MCLLLMLDKVISVIQQQIRKAVIHQELIVSLTYFRVNISLQSGHGITFWGLWPGIDSQLSNPICFQPAIGDEIVGKL